MRRRLALVALAVTSMTVLAFVVPLALLVREQAEDRALARAQRDAQAVAAALAVAGAIGADRPVDAALAQAVIDAASDDGSTSVYLPDGTVVGFPAPSSANVDRARAGAAFTVRGRAGAEVLVPVRLAEGTVVVRTEVPPDELRRGVTTSWLLLAALGLLIVGAASILADRLARSVVRPVGELADTAHRLGDGDLDARVRPSGPPEVVEVGDAFNSLAGRLGDLLAAERESVADLSHRLRTPLTALRLQAGTLDDETAAAEMLAEIDRLAAGVDQIITDARGPADAPRSSDLAAVATHRAAFWQVLAEEERRHFAVDVADAPLPVAMGADDLGALIDTLLENVFAHTPPGTAFRIATGRVGAGAVLVVEDDGPGFPAKDAVARGESGGGSTGLGLDIVARAAERTGGELRLTTPPTGGARAEVRFGG